MQVPDDFPSLIYSSIKARAMYQGLHASLADGVEILIPPTHSESSIPKDESREQIKERIERGSNDSKGGALHTCKHFGNQNDHVGYVGNSNSPSLAPLYLVALLLQITPPIKSYFHTFYHLT